MAIRIECCDIGGKHMELKPDGSIEIYFSKDREPITLDYRQASLLKAMILAEAELQEQERR